MTALPIELQPPQEAAPTIQILRHKSHSLTNDRHNPFFQSTEQTVHGIGQAWIVRCHATVPAPSSVSVKDFFCMGQLFSLFACYSCREGTIYPMPIQPCGSCMGLCRWACWERASPGGMKSLSPSSLLPQTDLLSDEATRKPAPADMLYK